MKELFRERALTRVIYFQSLIEAAGIETFLKNENVSALEGVSIPEFFPALCVVDDLEYDAAMKIIQEELLRTKEAITTEVVCSECGKLSPSNFDTCWSCQALLKKDENVV